jgi:glycosyltransferase involved in cell wall biosynthesis
VTPAPRVLIVVSADAARDAEKGPRRDYAVLAAALRARILDRSAVARSPIARALGRIAGPHAAQAWLAFQSRWAYDVVITDGEHVGIPLALLLRLTRAPMKHITIGHRLSTPKKRLFFTLLRADARMDRIIVHSRHQFDYATDELGIPPQRLTLMPYQVDTGFWTPAPVPVGDEPLLVSAGLEYRDYATLFSAVAGLPVRVVIGAASPWSRHKADELTPPPNVEVASFDYLALRDLYRRAALVVVPLTDIDNQAGVTTILEAMAVGKPVVVSQSLGQTDVVEDRRSGSRGLPRPRRTSLLRLVALESGVDPEPNGFYVPPGEPEALRRAIVYLVERPDERAQLGAAGRRAAEELLTVDQFAARVRAIVVGGLEPVPDARGLRRAWYG